MLRQPYFSLSSAAFSGLLQSKQALAQGALDGALLELVYLRISQINGCSYCLDLHCQALRQRAVPQAKLDALAGWHASDLFSQPERLALQWAEALTALPASHASEQDYQPLLACFSAEQISDLTLACALMNAFNRVAVGMRQ